jgi:hypothetical protein
LIGKAEIESDRNQPSLATLKPIPGREEDTVHLRVKGIQPLKKRRCAGKGILQDGII